ncbi:SIMPL domain-containing protein [Rhodococcus sp. ABRD24]|uniref:SIMPL domain-containing protein n=1 Tax=Rhodococcus sp. ABRD24 TaxID=2507582 RepID=UPI00103DCCD4|nr:SIMPL domain-containing protein [Rhodococcus sp. ABRD24]QBJ97883.1 SIMPL domain-containing protein [Rhodococcus sp. ABRD24]
MPTNPVTITVTGHANRTFAPNRCVVHVSVAFDGATRAEAANPAAKSAAALTELIRTVAKHPQHPIRRWSLDQVQHSRYRPYHPNGKKLPWNYQSTASGSVTFRDASAVAPFIDQASAIEGVDVGRLEWKLTRKIRTKALAQVRDLAVRDALAKAEGYTQSLGCRRIEAVALADPGMLNGGQRPDYGAPSMRMMAASAPAHDTAERPAIELTPEPIHVSADVEARFEAS